MKPAASVVTVLFIAVATLWSHSADSAQISRFLNHPVIDPAQPQAEVQKFVEERVPKMPRVKSLAEWGRYANRMREDTLNNVIFRGATHWRDAKTKVEWLDTVAGGPGYKIRKLRYEVVPGLWTAALIYLPDNMKGKVPVVLNVNGHDRKDGKAADYKQMRCINQAKRGMIALNAEWLGMGQLNSPGFEHYKMPQLDLCGVSGISTFYLAMSRALDILLELPNADPKRVAVAGLSGGGWQTIFISSLDTRVTLCNPVAGYSGYLTRIYNHSDLGDCEQTPNDLATVADYTHLTALLAPRPALLTFNVKDNCCFASDHALPPLLDAAKPIYRLYAKDDSLRSHVNHDPGTHNFLKDNRQQFYKMLGDFFHPDDSSFDSSEIPSEKEIKSFDELSVPLPDNNHDFNTLARQAMKNLPRDKSIASSVIWRNQRRVKLRELINAKAYQVTPKIIGRDKGQEVTAVFRQLKLGEDWTIPATEMTGDLIRGTTIVVADGGRKSVEKQVAELIQNGQRVLAVDPFYLGESKIVSRDFLFALMVATVGERPIGIQASQLGSVAAWANRIFRDGPITIRAIGPRICTAAIIAAGLNPQSVSSLDLEQALPSLRTPIEKDWNVRAAPELFCFGLLEEFDIPQLKALVGAHRIKVRSSL